MGSEVHIVRCPGYENVGEAVRSSLERLDVDFRGKRVLIKPNVLGPFPPDRHVCTRPEVVREVCTAIEEKGADSVSVGDNPGVTGYGANENAHRVSGVYDAADGRYVNLATETITTRLETPNGLDVPVSTATLEADVVVNVPKFKTHSQTTITGAVKNTFGYIAGGVKAKLHAAAPTPTSFAKVCVETYGLRPPEVNIMDAVVGMEGDGPSSNDLRDIGLVLASTNGAALDVVVARLMGIDPRLVPTVQVTREYGLCPPEKEIEVFGPAEPVPGFRPPTTFIRNRFVYWLTNRFLFTQVTPKPYIDTRVCNECGRCAEICPVGALTEFPAVDYDLCIRCYCCQEICPNTAVKLRGRFKKAVRRGAFITGGLSPRT